MDTIEGNRSVVTTTVVMSSIFEDPRYQIAAVTSFALIFILCCVGLVLCCVRRKRSCSPHQLYVSMGSLSPGITTFVASGNNAHYRLLEEFDGHEAEALLGQPNQLPESRRLFAAANPDEQTKEKGSEGRRKISDNEHHPRYETVPDYPQKDVSAVTFKI